MSSTILRMFLVIRGLCPCRETVERTRKVIGIAEGGFGILTRQALITVLSNSIKAGFALVRWGGGGGSRPKTKTCVARLDYFLRVSTTPLGG